MLPVSQRVPSYPSVQSQLNEFTWLMQEPPFWQDVDEHSSISGFEITKIRRIILWIIYRWVPFASLTFTMMLCYSLLIHWYNLDICWDRNTLQSKFLNIHFLYHISFFLLAYLFHSASLHTHLNSYIGMNSLGRCKKHHFDRARKNTRRLLS